MLRLSKRTSRGSLRHGQQQQQQQPQRGQELSSRVDHLYLFGLSGFFLSKTFLYSLKLMCIIRFFTVFGLRIMFIVALVFSLGN